LESEHDLIVQRISSSIKKTNKKIRIFTPFIYSPQRKSNLCEIDLAAFISNKICIFEIKSGSKENKAKKQLEFHKKQISVLRLRIANKYNLVFSAIKSFWVANEYNIIVNIETNEQIVFDPTLIENPLEFLLR